MNKVIPRTLPGFMELLPQDQILFNNMYDTIRKVYERFGFLPIDTPVIEASEVLLAKAGGETEKQIYRFNKGDNDLSLRFDLTVPLAKFVVEKALPKFFEDLGKAIQFFSSIVKKIWSVLEDFIEDFINPIVEFAEPYIISFFEKYILVKTTNIKN